MKKTELQKLKNKTTAELEMEAKTLKDNLWQLKVDLAAGKIKNALIISQTKKNIARINTLIKERSR